VPTAIVAAIRSNLRLAARPGNVRLRKGEAGLPRPSVVNASQIRTVDRARLGERIGALGAERMRQVLVGLALCIGPEIPAGDEG
jgi:mRNA interferase MazF